MIKRVVLQDIADALQVSKNTVSHALRDLDDISVELKEKIKNKATEMGYIPNNLSIFLRENKSKLIGIVTCDLINSYYAIQIDNLIKKLRENGYLAITILTESGYLDFDFFKYLLNYQVGAIISFQDLTEETYNFLKKRHFPIVLYGLISKFEGIPSVYTDDYYGGVLIAKEFLREKKYKKPCYVCWSDDVETAIRRKNGFFDELNKHGINPDIYIIGYNNIAQCKKIIENNNDFIFSYCDTLGIDIKDYLNRQKYKKFNIFGFDGIHHYIKANKEIKGIYADTSEMSQYATEEVKKAISDNNYLIKSKMFTVYLDK